MYYSGVYQLSIDYDVESSYYSKSNTLGFLIIPKKISNFEFSLHLHLDVNTSPVGFNSSESYMLFEGPDDYLEFSIYDAEFYDEKYGWNNIFKFYDDFIDIEISKGTYIKGYNEQIYVGFLNDWILGEVTNLIVKDE
jgi:hypothetical protein